MSVFPVEVPFGNRVENLAGLVTACLVMPLKQLGLKVSRVSVTRDGAEVVVTDAKGKDHTIEVDASKVKVAFPHEFEERTTAESRFELIKAMQKAMDKYLRISSTYELSSCTLIIYDFKKRETRSIVLMRPE
jgi:hypothetical protein